MKNLVVFGGTGGLGQKLIPLLKEKYNVISLGSRDVDITNILNVKSFFNENDVDIVINMSGKFYDIRLSNIKIEDAQTISDVINVNIIGNINILSSCLPKMIEKKWGRVIGMSSILSEINVPKATIYSASKAFIDRLYSGANKENIKHGITLNTIQLGYWDGGMCEKIEPEFREKIRNNIGLRRWGNIEELYNTIEYIINNEYFCGTNIKLNGGL